DAFLLSTDQRRFQLLRRVENYCTPIQPAYQCGGPASFLPGAFRITRRENLLRQPAKLLQPPPGLLPQRLSYSFGFLPAAAPDAALVFFLLLFAASSLITSAQSALAHTSF